LRSLTVLGASGFIGRRLARAATDRGLAVRAISRTPLEAYGAAEAVQISDYRLAPVARERGEVLVHLAQSSRIDAPQDVSAALDLMDHLNGLGYAQVCFGSSAVVYGDVQPHAHRVEETPVPVSPYGEHKLRCEQRVLQRDGSAARFVNIYGPGQSASTVLERILTQLPAAGPLRLWSVDPVRDFCWVEDACAAVLDWCQRGARGVFNVGSGAAVTIGALARRCLEIAGQADREVQVEHPNERPSILRVDIAATTQRCGWQPRTSLDSGLTQMIGAFS
jgi:nucleoside-diphosphate-sugar epimerase